MYLPDIPLSIFGFRQLGIPQDAVVLCNFNKLDKIDFVSFQVWMQVMGILNVVLVYI
ncbi:hypothetical protein EON65_11055 [archaeon]|nr:MAG: hypothetical protein EON65_11055 [archaeon]